MFNKEKIEVFKEFSSFIINEIPGGALFIAVHDNVVTWRSASNSFNLDILQLGSQISSQGPAAKAFREKKDVTENIPRTIYGVRVVVSASPIIDENGKVIGTICIIRPKLHPLAAAFDIFADIMAEMFPEGAVLYVSDLEKFAYCKSSQKFDLQQVRVGTKLLDNSSAARAIASRKMVIAELDASEYGVPVLASSYPLFEEGSNEVIGSFGIILPKQTSAKLREMSNALNEGMSGISATVEQVAASANEIFVNEQALNKNVNDIYKISEEINQVLGFINQIAEQSKMLGLNAAIEAARAGEYGKGFGVVANEIRKMADDSKNTVVKIKNFTGLISDKITETSKSSEHTLMSSQEQAAATQQITASMEEIASLADELSTLAKNI